MKLKNVMILSIFVISGLAIAQNTQRTPLQGGATNPISPSEAPQTSIIPETAAHAKSKKKTKGKVTTVPPESTPRKPEPTVVP